MPEGDGGEIGDGSEAGDEIEGGASPARSPGNDLCIESGGMRGELQVLFHGTARVKRNLEAGEIVDRLRPYCAIREWSRRGSGQYRIHGHGEPF